MVGAKGIPARHGGIERHVDEIAQRLAGVGHHVDVFTRQHHPVDTAFHEGVRLRRRWSVHTKHLDAATHTAWCVLEAALSHRYDLLHVHGIGPGLFVPPRWLGLRTVFTYHAQDWRQRKWGRLARWSLQRGERHAVRTASEVITVSRLLQHYVLERYGRSAHHIPNGATLPGPQGVDHLHGLSLHPGSYVLFVGRLIADRGVDTLVEAFRDVPGTLQLAIVGEVHLGEDEMRHLRSRADTRVRFLGQQTGEALQQLYAHAAFCVHPSRVEGLPIAVLEAMSHGRAVIVSDIPENLEAIGDAALTFPVGDVATLRQRMRSLQENPPECAELGERARQRIAAHFDWDPIAMRTEAVYRQALGSARAHLVAPGRRDC
jgi:glycosyltransferase involved in cell wall biosynthesis